ncbi:cAMP-responsive element modulator isoform X1 [Hippocampus zosterae]|uniref:cAMP-responsive element modulator isoform X1 n=1 Tax=Hippocampus zosterae TaxID=109293 RepID=UPI00223DF014|nr:cAMP-responsive element modulator isoform X1 [Hippocampus zosterae]
MDDSANDSTADEEEHLDGMSPSRVLDKREDHESDGDLPTGRPTASMDEYLREEGDDSTSLTSCHLRSGQYAAISQSAAAASSGGAHQFYIHAGQMIIQAATGDIPACQLRSPTSGLAHSIVLAAAAPGATHSPVSHHAEEVTRKREVRLMKNREAARECRRKKKEYVKCLENRVAVLENQNKTLIEELKALKDIYCHKGE